ncbi:MAG: S41 family peptidase [Chloroflexota bacterium]|nr:S41 family peptidase [Chloroflexota bacterium]
MKKIVAILSALVILSILLVGTFSAGLLTGRFIFPQDGSIVPNLLPSLGEESSTAPASSPNTQPSGLDESFAPFWEAWDIVHEQYVDQPVDDEALMNGAIQGMLATFEYTPNTTYETLVIPSGDDTGTPEELQELFVPFWESWTFAHNPDNQALVYGAISGMLNALGDQHTSYMTPDQFTQANIPLNGTYEGIGAWVDPNREYLTIVAPMESSPSEQAGLMPGDEIIAVDGEDMTGIDGNLVIRRVLGPANSKVILTIQREGVDEPFDVEITRAEITIPSVDYRMLDDDIAYIHLLTFGEDTRDELRNAIEELLEEDPVGLIFDLRNNGGGYLVTAVEVASEFIDEGTIMYEEYGDDSRDTYEAKGDGLATEIPLVVLVNTGTASASEIVSGAIQDYERAPLVGTTTFGKGSVQNWIPLSDNQGALRVTIARWLTPDEQLIHEVGLKPDFPLAVVAQAAIDEGFDPESFGLPSDQVIILNDEDIQNGRDPQLDKAVKVLEVLIEESK